MRKGISRIFLILVATISIVFASIQLGGPILVGAAPTCCTYGIECSGAGKDGEDLLCCFPLPGQAPCSYEKEYYCRDAC